MPTHDTSSQSLLWAIQNHPQSKNPALLAQACAAAGFDALLLEASDDELPGVPWDRPVLFYGSCRFVSNVQRSGRWRPCAYFDPQLLRFSAYLEHYGARLLNHDAHSMRLCDAGDLPAGEKFFVRCDADSKELAGDVWSGAQLHSYVDKLLEANATALLDLPIVVAARRRIDYEWRLFVADVGQDSFEEIDIVTKGGNYGWNTMEGDHCFNPPSGCNMAGLVLPIVEIPHPEGEAVIGGFIYHGTALAGMQGQYIFGDLNGQIWSLIENPPNTFTRNLILKPGFNISSFGQDSAGELYVVDISGGRVLKIVPK